MDSSIALPNLSRPLTAPSPERSWLRSYRTRLRVTDSAIVVASVLAAYLVGLYSSGAAPRALDISLAVIVAGLWLATLSAYRTRDLRLLGSGAAEYRVVMNASILSFGCLAIATLLLRLDDTREFFAIALPAGTVSLLGCRWLWRKWLTGQRRYGHYLSRALVVGGHADVEYVIRQIDRVGACYNIVGTVLESASVKNGASASTASVSNDSTISLGEHEEVILVTDLGAVADTARRLSADVVIVAGQPAGQREFIRDLAWELEGSATELILASRLTNVAGPRIHFRPVEGLPLMHVELPQYDGGKHVLKRFFDAVSASLGLAVAMPVLLVIGLLIHLDSPGPVLFRQERVGRDGRTFTLLKLRTMVVGADRDLSVLGASNDGAGLLFKLRDDPRVTRIGRILRRYSLDEIPQLWNVIMGDMSLVGPRPPLPREVANYAGHVRRRLYIKPGLTGMWQINGRSNLSWEDSVRLDLYYVENWSLAGDLLILWRTVRVVLKPEGSY